MRNILIKHRITLFLTISLLIHAVMLSSDRLKAFLFGTLTALKDDQIVELVILDEKSNQVVNRQEKANERAPEKSKYLSNKNNTVEEESNKKPTPRRQRQASAPQKRKAITKPITGDLPALEKLKVDFNDFERISQNLTPPEVTDFLPNVKEKEKTALNTREFVFFSFYERVKKRLGMFWTPALEQKFQKMYYANIEVDDRDLVTKLIIVLDHEGNIKRIERLESSGFKDLDNAAIEAFTRAAPFSNPPKGILDDDNTVVIKWDFILKTENESIGFVLSQL